MRGHGDSPVRMQRASSQGRQHRALSIVNRMGRNCLPVLLCSCGVVDSGRCLMEFGLKPFLKSKDQLSVVLPRNVPNSKIRLAVTI
jgi:hypothetical protein